MVIVSTRYPNLSAQPEMVLQRGGGARTGSPSPPTPITAIPPPRICCRRPDNTFFSGLTGDPSLRHVDAASTGCWTAGQACPIFIRPLVLLCRTPSFYTPLVVRPLDTLAGRFTLSKGRVRYGRRNQPYEAQHWRLHESQP